MSDMLYKRMLDKDHKPTDKDIIKTIGDTALWLKLRQYIEEHYDFTAELVFYGQKYGWTLRYRKSGKTLCSLLPEKGAFTALVVLGKDEAEKALSMMDEFNPKIRNLLRTSEQLHDGRWLWIRVLTVDDVNNIKELLKIKRKPKN